MGDRHLDEAGFRQLMQSLADPWESGDIEAGLRCFTADAAYMEPPDIQLFAGQDELGQYFGAVEPGTFMRWHDLWFDKQHQTGAGEFSFGLHGQPTSDHGMCAVELRDGRIALWREYQRTGPADWQLFVSATGKDWQWHAGNYPAKPTD
jgi:ketosteroid isomerase-like protein